MKKIIKILIPLLIIGASVAILGFNAGGIRDTYLRPVLEKVPIVSNLLPPIEEVELSEEEMEILRQEQLALEAEEAALSKEQETIALLQAEIQDLNAEISRLSEFEAVQETYKIQKASFDEMIANEDPQAYKSFYESVSPDNAEELYKQVVQTANKSAEFTEYIKTFENMKTSPATAIIEELVTTDMDLVIEILEALTSDKRGDILAAMNATTAASVTKLLSPDN